MCKIHNKCIKVKAQLKLASGMLGMSVHSQRKISVCRIWINLYYASSPDRAPSFQKMKKCRFVQRIVKQVNDNPKYHPAVC